MAAEAFEVVTTTRRTSWIRKDPGSSTCRRNRPPRSGVSRVFTRTRPQFHGEWVMFGLSLGPWHPALSGSGRERAL